jgi:hypothetical protein
MAKPDEDAPESIMLQQFSGIKNTVAPERLSAAELEKAVNVDIDDAGQVRRRRGYTLAAAGNFHSLKTIGGKVYGVKDGVLGIIRADYSFKTLHTVNAAVCYTEVDREVYFSSASASGIIERNESVSAWGVTDGQGQWLSPVIAPTETLGAIGGKLLGDPPKATSLAAYKGRIYLAVRNVLWATELYQYHYVDKTKNYMQFEHDITLLLAMEDGLYVGTTGGLYFIQGILGQFKLSQVSAAAVLAGSDAWAPADLVHPQARNAPVPTGEAVLMMTAEGILAGFDGGTAYNLTQDRMVFPQGLSAAGVFRRDAGVTSYVAAVDSAGGPTANARIGDYVDAEIIRFGGN